MEAVQPLVLYHASEGMEDAFELLLYLHLGSITTSWLSLVPHQVTRTTRTRHLPQPCARWLPVMDEREKLTHVCCPVCGVGGTEPSSTHLSRPM